MSHANILVSVALAESAPNRVRLAADLASRFAATLTGAAPAEVPVPIIVHDIRDAIAKRNQSRDELLHALDHARAPVERRAGAAHRSAWLRTFDRPASHFVEKASAADLRVSGAAQHSGAASGRLTVALGPVPIEAGSSAVVVPVAVVRLTGARIVVAWTNTVEARRAVSGALPFLRRAEQVFVVTDGGGAQFQGAQDVVAHLAHHGASATAHLLTTAVGGGDQILRFAREHSADLVVMGAYGQSRLREWAFGGATREILQASRVCCLMVP